MKPNEYQCAHCGGVFEKEWTDEEANAEYTRDFAEEEAAGEPKDIICDDCYKKFSMWFRDEKELTQQ